jgi:hypothetical protein
VSRGKGANAIALLVDGLEFGAEVNGAWVLVTPALVESSDADRISCGNHSVRSVGSIEKDEAEHAVEQFDKVGTVFFVEVKDDLAIGLGLKLGIVVFEILAELAMVVNLAVDGKNELSICGDQRLSACGDADDG